MQSMLTTNWFVPAYQGTRDLSDRSNIQCMVWKRRAPPPLEPPRNCEHPKETSPPPAHHIRFNFIYC